MNQRQLAEQEDISGQRVLDACQNAENYVKARRRAEIQHKAVPNDGDRQAMTDLDLKSLKGKLYPMVLRGAGDTPPEVRIEADGSVEFVNFLPDPASKELFILLGKDIAHEWRVKAGFEKPTSIYTVQHP